MKIADLFTKVDKLDVDKARELLKEKGEGGVTLLDVREPSEYAQGHIPGARFMPLSGVPDNVNKLDPSGTIITYCKRGPRSRSAAALLKRIGFDKVFYMEGGIDAWNGLVASGPYESGMFLLEDRESFEDLIALAWSLEDGTGLFYSHIKDMMPDDEAKEIFGSLVKAEERHKAKVLDAYRNIKGQSISDETLKKKAVAGFIEGGVSFDSAISWIERGKGRLLDIMEISMQAETNSLDLYMKMYEEVKSEGAKEIFILLIKEEKEHLARLGKLLDSKLH